MRIIGLDVGSKTIGVAVSDPLGWTAQGVSTLMRDTTLKDCQEIGRLAAEYEAERIVVGLPLNMDGTEGKGAAFVRGFAGELKSRMPEKDIIYWDERLSTVGAERSLLEADLSRAKRKKVINKMAAVFILQGYLDSQSPLS